MLRALRVQSVVCVRIDTARVRERVGSGINYDVYNGSRNELNAAKTSIRTRAPQTFPWSSRGTDPAAADNLAAGEAIFRNKNIPRRGRFMCDIISRLCPVNIIAPVSSCRIHCSALGNVDEY